jgi:hypothetical protein
VGYIIKQHFHTAWIFFVGSGVIMVLLSIVLMIEYRFFRVQIKQYVALQQEYTRYMENIQDLLKMYVSDEEENGKFACIFDESSDDTLLLLNRHPRYLKGSAWDYFQENALTGLFGHINEDAWEEYTDSVMHEQQKEKVLTSIGYHAPASVQKKPQQKRAQRSSFAAKLIWPIDRDQFWVSSLFGPRRKKDGSRGFHYGVDMAALKGTPVKAVKDGVVEQAGTISGYGNTVLLNHGNGLKTRYAHLHAIVVRKGQRVKEGTIIGKVGETGFIRKKTKDGSHLHFEVYEHGRHINPLAALPSLF